MDSTTSISRLAPRTKPTHRSHRVAKGTGEVPQLGLGRILGVWAAAALPMAFLAWVIAPRLADQLTGGSTLARSLLITLTFGLVWQFALVLILVGREQGTLRWSVLRDALWLRAPRAPSTGRRGGRPGSRRAPV